MVMNSIQIGARKVGDVLLKNSPSILTGLSVAGLVTTVIMAVGATPKAMKIIEKEEERRGVDDGKDGWMPIPVTRVDVIKLVWKCYIPTVLMGLTTGGMMIGANSINLRRNAALATVYSLAETTLKEYQAKVVETLGERKEGKVRDDISQDRLNKHPVNEKSIVVTGNGEILCFDSISGRYFKSSMEAIKKAQNDFNFRVMNELYLTLNEFYDLLGMPPINVGEKLAWATDLGLLDIHFATQLATGDYNGQPCLVLDYEVYPRLMG